MKLVNLNPFLLRKNGWNTNRVDRENFEKLKLSLKSLGAFKPVTVRELDDGTLEILCGYHRTEAAKELGFPEIPVLNIGKVDDDRAKEISLVDNTRYGQDDAEALSKLLETFDTELIEAILPETSVELPETDDALAGLEDELKTIKREEEDFKTLKFRLPTDKAEDVEALLSKIAHEFGYKYPDGYSNYNEALHHLALRYSD